jgi:hypothetical protein
MLKMNVKTAQIQAAMGEKSIFSFDKGHTIGLNLNNGRIGDSQVFPDEPLKKPTDSKKNGREV